MGAFWVSKPAQLGRGEFLINKYSSRVFPTPSLSQFLSLNIKLPLNPQSASILMVRGVSYVDLFPLGKSHWIVKDR